MRTTTPPVEALSTLHEYAMRALTDFDVLPARHAQPFQRVWASLMASATHAGHTTVGQLLKHQSQILQQATGLGPLTAAAPAAERNTYHQYRNTLLTVVLAGYLAGAGSPPHPTDLVRALKHQRTGSTGRPAADDEIALARVWALLKARTTQGTVAAATYTLCDAGMRLDETKATQISDFDDPDDPALVLASGRERLAARFLPLDDFHRAALATRIAHVRRRGSDALLYAPRTSRPSATSALASAINTMNRHYAEIGLDHGDLQPASISNWRVAYVWETQGKAAAKSISGMSTKAMETALGLTRQITPEKRPDPATKGTRKAL